jgi:hypothetical protein
MKNILIALFMIPTLSFSQWALDFDELWATAGEELLPAGYTECEYISATGTQYIDTGIKLSCINSVTIVFEAASVAIYGIFGGRTGQTRVSYAMFCFQDKFRYDMRSAQVKGALSYSAATKYTAVVTPTAATINGTLDASLVCDDLATIYNCFLMAVNTAGTANPTLSGRLYGASITEAGGATIANFVPCLNPSGTPGVYDTIRKQFFSNAGSGNFGYEVK